MVLNLLFLAVLTCQTGMSGGQPPLGMTSRSWLQTLLSGYKREPWFDVNDEHRWAQKSGRGQHLPVVTASHTSMYGL